MKGYLEPVPILSIDEGNRIVPVYSNGNRKWYAISKVKLYEGPKIESDKTMEDMGTVLGPWSVRYSNEKIGNDGPEEYSVHTTEVIMEGDPIHKKRKMEDAILKEIEGRLKRGIFKIVVRKEIPHDSNILGGRFFLAIKNPNIDEEIYEAQFVVQGHCDRYKPFLVHVSLTRRQYL